MNTNVSIERKTQNDILHVTGTFLGEWQSYVNGKTSMVVTCKHCHDIAECSHDDDVSFKELADRVEHKRKCPVLSAQRVERAITQSIVAGVYN